MEELRMSDGKVIYPERIMEIAIEAGKEVLRIYDGEIEVEDKFSEFDEGQVSPLTKADIQSNKKICEKLKEFHPEIPLLSEENKEVAFDERKDWDLFWLIDPLDGTKEFINRNGEFTVNIALVRGNNPILGVVHVPVKNVIYYGDMINGSFKVVGQEAPFKVGKIQKDSKKIRVIASKSHFNQETKDFIEGLKQRYEEVEMVNAGSSLKLCLVAEGKADIYPRLGPTMEWDTAAAHAVTKFAGKNVYRIEDEKEMEYNKESLLNPFFIVK